MELEDDKDDNDDNADNDDNDDSLVDNESMPTIVAPQPPTTRSASAPQEPTAHEPNLAPEPAVDEPPRHITREYLSLSLEEVSVRLRCWLSPAETGLRDRHFSSCTAWAA